MGYVYAAAMFLAGVFIIYFAVKENKLFCIIGAYFILMGIYRLINELTPSIDLLSGVYLIVYRCVTAAVAVLAIILYFIHRKNIMNKQ